MTVSAIVSRFTEQIYYTVTGFNINVYEKSQQDSGRRTVAGF